MRFWKWFVILTLVATMGMAINVFAQDPYGGGAQAQASKLAPTVQDFQNRMQSDGSFVGPWDVTYYPHESGATPRTIRNVPYVTVLSSGVLIVPLKNREGTRFIYTNNWSLDPVQKTNTAK